MPTLGQSVTKSADAAEVIRLALCAYLGLPDSEAALKVGRPSLDDLARRARASKLEK